MRSLVLRAKHWQIFIALFLSVEIIGFPFWPADFAYQLLSAIRNVSTIGWMLWVGVELNQRSPVRQKPLPALLFGFGFTVLAVASIFPGVRELVSQLHIGIALALAIICLIGLCIVASLPASALKSIELQEEVDINDYFNYMLLFLFWPFGIWYLQPRINKLFDSKSGEDGGVVPEAVPTMPVGLNWSTINKAIGFGILVFIIGYGAGIFWIEYFQILMPIGFLSTAWGTYAYLKYTNLRAEFRIDPKEDGLTYFWNVIVLKFWTAIMLLFMISVCVQLLTKGWF